MYPKHHFYELGSQIKLHPKTVIKITDVQTTCLLKPLKLKFRVKLQFVNMTTMVVLFSKQQNTFCCYALLKKMVLQGSFSKDNGSIENNEHSKKHVHASYGEVLLQVDGEWFLYGSEQNTLGKGALQHQEGSAVVMM